MTRPAYVFVDFDGVTHPWGDVEDFRALPLIESVLREFDEARIVIASDWRMLFSLRNLVARFAEDIRPRVVGASPQLLPGKGVDMRGLREREAMQWLRQHDPDGEDAPWCAIDDAPGNWPSRARLVLTDFKRGFTDEDAVVLRRLLTEFRAGKMAPRVVERVPSLWERTA